MAKISQIYQTMAEIWPSEEIHFNRKSPEITVLRLIQNIMNRSKTILKIDF